MALNFLPGLKIMEAFVAFFAETASGVVLAVPFTLI